MVANGKVVPLNLQLSSTQLIIMKIVISSVDFGLFFLLCSIYLVHSGTSAAQLCPAENCKSSGDKCLEVSYRVCADPEDTCCSVVKGEFATLCKQHGGICRSDFCGKQLQRQVTDCEKNEVCCVLVV